MSRRLSIVVLVLVLAGGLVWILRPDAVSTVPLLVPDSAPPRAAPEPVEEAVPSGVLLEKHEVARVPEVAPPPTLPVSEFAHTAVSSAAVLRGRLLFDGEAPAVGAALLLNGSLQSSERLREFGAPEHWENLTGGSGMDGRFVLTFDPPRAFRFELYVSYPDFAGLSWHWDQILPGSTVDVGDVVLLRAGTIAGKVVDRSGNPVPGEWVVYGEGVRTELAGDRVETCAIAEADPSTAEYRLEGLLPGLIRLKVHGQNVGWIDGPTVEARAGEEVLALIRCEGPDISRRLTVSTFTQPFLIFSDEVNAIRLLRDAVEIARAKPLEGSTSSFVFEDLDPDDYEVVIEDEKFEPWSRSGLRPGNEVQARLVGNAGILLDVRDAVSGERLPRYQLDVAFAFPGGRMVSPNLFRIQNQEEDPPIDGTYLGMIPHDCEIIVTADGYARAKVLAAGLAPNERRRLVAELERGRTITAFVLQAGGQPVEGVNVALHHGVVEEGQLTDYATRIAREAKEGAPLTARTDAGGHAAFEGLSRGIWTLIASGGGSARAQAVVELGEEELVSVELRFPSLAYVSGRVVAPGRLQWNGWEIVASRKMDESEGRSGDPWNASSSADLDTNGRFRLGPLAPEDWSVTLVLPHGGDSRLCFADPGTIELERLTITCGEELKREYELGARAPGRLQVAVTTNGATATGVIVELRGLGENRSIEAVPVAFGVTEAGVAQLDIVPPGNWRLIARDIESRWAWGSPALVEIGSDPEERISIALELVSGRLEVHELGTSAPLESRILWSCDASGFVVNGELEADSRGIVEVMLPPGEYRMEAPGGRPADSVLLNWSSSGLSPAIIELPRKRR